MNKVRYRDFRIETELNIIAVKNRIKTCEIPGLERKRLHGQSNLNVVTDGTKILMLILKEGIKGLFGR